MARKETRVCFACVSPFTPGLVIGRLNPIRLSPVVVIKRTAQKSGLRVVPFGRFRLIYVDRVGVISDFVRKMGLEFQTGRGFYEFTKPELIQEAKEVVLLENKTGRLFTGAQARNLIGLPYGLRAKVYPARLPGYTIFVQSTSWNRKLIAGTRFLYEAENR